MEKNIIATFGGSEHVSNDPGYVSIIKLSILTFLPSEKCSSVDSLGKLLRVFFQISKTNQLEIDFAEGLKEYFSKFGVVSEAMVMRDPTTKHSR